MTKLYLDMDGVLTNFVLATAEIFGFQESQLSDWNIYEHIGVTEEHFWAEIDSHSPRFWAEMPEYPWALSLYSALNEVPDSELYICTAPSRDPNCIKGKLMWIQKRLGDRFNNYVITPHKGLLADEESILIDDRIKNCVDFHKAGGTAIVFPQKWNVDEEHIPRHRKDYILENVLHVIEKRNEPTKPQE